MNSRTARQVIETLQRNGFIPVRSSGSHRTFKRHPDGPMVIVPVHGGNRALKIGTLLSIVRQSGLPKSAFFDTAS